MNKTKVDDATVLVGFELPSAVAADSVSVCGDFNDWSPQTHPLTRLDDGDFRAEVPLPAGRCWRFRYLLDGERWENDWAADDYVPNGLGGDDSVVDLTDTSTLSGLALSGADDSPVIRTGSTPGEPDDAGATPERSEGLLTRWLRRLTHRGADRGAAAQLAGLNS